MKNVLAFVAVLCIVASPAPIRAQEPGTRKAMKVRFNGQAALTVPLESKAVKGGPYSAEIINESTQSLQDGNHIAQRSTGRVYRDSQGRVRREEDHAAGEPSVSIIDSEAGVSYSLDPKSHIAWKTALQVSRVIVEKMSAAALAELHNVTPEERKIEAEQRSQEGAHRKQEAELMAAKLGGGFMEKQNIQELHSEEVLGARSIEGVQAVGHRRTTTIPAGAIGNDLPITIVSEEWVSPDLNLLVMTHRVDPRSGESSYRLVNIHREEPDPSLFQVPPDYPVRETGIRRLEPKPQE